MWSWMERPNLRLRRPKCRLDGQRKLLPGAASPPARIARAHARGHGRALDLALARALARVLALDHVPWVRGRASQSETRSAFAA